MREDAQDVRMRRAGQSSRRPPALLRNPQKKGFLATQPARRRARPAGSHGSVVVKQCAEAAPHPAAPLASPPAQLWRVHPWPGDLSVTLPSPGAVTVPYQPLQLCTGGFFQGHRVTTARAKDAAVPGCFFLFLPSVCCDCSTPTFHPTLTQGLL